MQEKILFVYLAFPDNLSITGIRYTFLSSLAEDTIWAKILSHLRELFIYFSLGISDVHMRDLHEVYMLLNCLTFSC